MEKHCCAFALVGADFKAADADMADATAGSFHPPPPFLATLLLFHSASLGSRHRAEN